MNVSDDSGRTALMVASSIGDLEAVRMILKHKNVNTNAKDKKGHTAFYLASYRGRWRVVRELLQYDMVDTNAQGALGNTALIWATLRGCLPGHCSHAVTTQQTRRCMRKEQSRVDCSRYCSQA